MASDLEKTLEGLPGWVVPAVIVGVVLLALMSRRNSNAGGGGGYGEVTAYSPIPADPGIIALEQSKISARSHLLETFADDLTSEHISGIGAARDEYISGINADIQNRKTAAQLTAAQAAEATRQLIGVHATDAQVAIAQANARASVDITNSQGATAKYVAKKQNNPLNHAIDQVGNVIAKLNPFHW